MFEVDDKRVFDLETDCVTGDDEFYCGAFLELYPDGDAAFYSGDLVEDGPWRIDDGLLVVDLNAGTRRYNIGDESLTDVESGAVYNE